MYVPSVGEKFEAVQHCRDAVEYTEGRHVRIVNNEPARGNPMRVTKRSKGSVIVATDRYGEKRWLSLLVAF